MDQTIRFVTANDGVELAYAMSGVGPPLLKATNWLNHLEIDWQSPVWRHWFDLLSHHHQLCRYRARVAMIIPFTRRARMKRLESQLLSAGVSASSDAQIAHAVLRQTAVCPRRAARFRLFALTWWRHCPCLRLERQKTEIEPAHRD